MEITTQELPKSQCNNTDIKNTEFSDTDSIFPSGNGGMMDENDRYQEYFDYFSDQLSMDLLKKDYPYDSEMLDNILEVIVETVCTKRPLIRIGAEASGRNCPQSVYETECRTHSICYGLLQGEHHKD